MTHLDTSFLIRALNPGSLEDGRLREWVAAGETVTMSAVAWAEFLCGPLGGAELELAERIVARRREFTEEQAATAARLFNASGRRRGLFIDCLIAAAALADGAPLATTNAADFGPFKSAGLTLAQC